MSRLFLKATIAATALMALSGVAAAEVVARATVDLNIRSGPGPQYPVIGVVGANQGATINGCQEGSKWCLVVAEGIEGWAYSDYLAAPFGGEDHVVVTERPPEALPPVSYEAVPSVRTEVARDQLIGRKTMFGTIEPIPAPPPTVRTYVETNRIEPVYLDGEVTVGTALPPTVPVREIPDYRYSYVYVNEQPVLVEPESRRIVYVMR